MKKFLGLVAAVIISTSAVFADGYKGDFQLLLGAGFDNLIAETGNITINSYPLQDYKVEQDTGLFTLNLETWHVFGSNDVFKFGFMAALDDGFGGTTRFAQSAKGNGTMEADPEDRFFSYRSGLFIAPAFSFFIGDVVRFNVAPGLSILFADAGSTTDGYDYTILYTDAVGFGCELQAKFCPNARVSPVIGYRFTVNFSDKLKQLSSYDNSTNTIKMDSVVILTNTFNVGISWNW